jgi:hypothetical protein
MPRRLHWYRPENGYYHAKEAPGWGIAVEEAAARKYAFSTGGGRRGNLNGGWGGIGRRSRTRRRGRVRTSM